MGKKPAKAKKGKKSGGLTAEQALERLKAGNARFVSGTLEHPNDSEARRLELLKEQHPFAVVLTCSDSRVVPELLFDVGLGDLFCIEVAGNVTEPHGLASILYALAHLDPPPRPKLVVVMGHQSCGAVGAAIKYYGGSSGDGLIDVLVQAIEPSVTAAMAIEGENVELDSVVKLHAKLVAQELRMEFDALKDVKIVSAYYDFETGEVHFQ